MQTIIPFVKRYPYACLLAVQLLSVIFYGFMSDSATSRLIFSCFGLAVPILALLVVVRSPAVTWVATILVVPAILLTLLAGFSGLNHLLLWAHGLESVMYFYAAIGLIMYMFNDEVVTVDELFAAGATFTLLVWGFALAYSVCQQIYPQSMTALLEPSVPRTWMELLFMSFSIQSGTGMGDVMPIAKQARVIGIFQMFTGVMYLAIVVSRLVALTLKPKQN
ncbi:MAG: ion channel [Methylophilaceae bacterium]